MQILCVRSVPSKCPRGAGVQARSHGLRATARRLGLDPSVVGFLSSNNSFDVVGSKVFGLRALWVNRSGAVLNPLGPTPDRTVTDLWRLAGALART